MSNDKDNDSLLIYILIFWLFMFSCNSCDKADRLERRINDLEYKVK